MEKTPYSQDIEPVMRDVFKHLLRAVIDKEKREQTTAHFSGIEMNFDDIRDEDIAMYLRIKENPGYTLPTLAEFEAYRESVSLSNNVSRYALAAYYGNLLTPTLVKRELEAQES